MRRARVSRVLLLCGPDESRPRRRECHGRGTIASPHGADAGSRAGRDFTPDRWSVPALVLGLAACLGACGSTPAAHFTGAVVLGAGGRAEGRISVPDGSAATVELSRSGPGAVDYAARTPDGRRLAAGALGGAEIRMGAGAPSAVVVDLVARPGAAATVAYSIRGAEGLDLKWDLSRAVPELPAPDPTR